MPRPVRQKSPDREDAPDHVNNPAAFDYTASAELFSTPSRHGKRRFSYRRFDTAAEALRFAIEEVPAPALLGAFLEVNEARFDLHQIHMLYANAAYPLPRAAAA